MLLCKLKVQMLKLAKCQLKLFGIVPPAKVITRICLHLFNLGFNVETVEYNNISLTIWDVNSHCKHRPMWRHYFKNTNGKDDPIYRLGTVSIKCIKRCMLEPSLVAQ